MESKTVLVTGGAGFIGSHVCERLTTDYHKVVCLDNFDNYYDPRIKRENLAHVKKHKNFKLVEGDVRDGKLLESVFSTHKFDGVVHLAALGGVRYSMDKPNLYVDVNVTGTVNVLEAVKKFNVSQFIFSSSSSVYGNRQTGPFKETDRTDEQISPYSVTKKTGELMSCTYAHLYGIKTTVLRFFNVYGPRVRPFMACSNFAEAILAGKAIVKYGDGTTGRDYTYIDDIVDGIVKAMEKPFKYEVINLGNSEPVYLNELIETFEKVIGKKARIGQQPLQAGDVELTFASIRKAKRLLGWNPKTNLESGLKKLIDWYVSK